MRTQRTQFKQRRVGRGHICWILRDFWRLYLLFVYIWAFTEMLKWFCKFSLYIERLKIQIKAQFVTFFKHTKKQLKTIHITNKNVISFLKQLFKWKNTVFSPFVKLAQSVNKQVMIRLIDLYCCQSPLLCYNHHSPVYDSKKKNSHV